MWLKLVVPPPLPPPACCFPLRCAEPNGVWGLGVGGSFLGSITPSPPRAKGRQGLAGGLWGLWAAAWCWAGSARGGAGWGGCSRRGLLVDCAPRPPCACACRWPRTLAGITAYQPCLQHPFAAGAASGGSAAEKQAWRRCDRAGRWEEGDYSHCLYTNDITRVLYTFVLVSWRPGGRQARPCGGGWRSR